MTPDQATKFQIAAGKRFQQLLRGQITQHQIEHPTKEDVDMIERLHRNAIDQVKREMFPKGSVHVSVNNANRVNVVKALWKQAA